MATSFQDFMKTVQPGMLDPTGKFKGPTGGVNYQLEGLTPEQAFSVAMQGPGPEIDGNGSAWKTMNDQQRKEFLDPSWVAGPDNGGGALGGFTRAIGNTATGIAHNPALMAALGGMAMQGMGVSGFTGAEGAEGFTGMGGAGGSLGPAGDFGAGTYAAGMPEAATGFSGMGGLGGSLGAAGDFGAGTYAAGAAGMGELSPLAAQTIAPGAGTVASVTAGTDAAGLAAAAPAATAGGTGGFMDSLSSISKIPGVSSLVGGALKGVVGGAINSALAPPTSGPGSAINAADPFHDQRAQYQAPLQKMMMGEFSPSDPSYSWRMGQGVQAIDRAAAAKGMLGSGNRLQALTEYGQGLASTEYQNQYNRLAQLSGANFGTGAAGNIAQQNATAQQGSANAVTGAIMDFGKGLYDNWNKSVSGPSSAFTGGANIADTLNFGD